MYTLLKNAEPKVLRILENSKLNNRLSHVYLFSGPKGSLKKEMAYNFAMMLYCKEDHPCYECETCKAILENRHLNVFYIEPLGQGIKKEQILALQDEFSKTSLVEGPRVYIINEAETMSVQAANSLLKFIEEPQSEIYGILICDDYDSMLPTIISRSINITFDPINKEVLSKELASEGIEDILVDGLTYLSNNKLEALKLNDDDAKRDTIKLIDKYLSLLKTNNTALFYRANIELLKDKDNVILFLNLLEALYRDMYETKLNGNVIVFKSKLDEIKEASSLIKDTDILKYLQLILEVQKKLRYNVGISLLFNELLIELRGGKI